MRAPPPTKNHSTKVATKEGPVKENTITRKIKRMQGLQ